MAMPSTFRLTTLACSATWALAAAAADAPDVGLAQVMAVDDQPVARPIVGATVPDGAELAFHVAVTYRCPAGTQGRQLFVSIADTARLEDVTAAPSPLTLRLDVPVKQLPWLLEPEHSCATVSAQRNPDEVDGSGTRHYRLHAGTAGYATLLCAPQGAPPSGATTAAPLDVWLSCPADSP